MINVETSAVNEKDSKTYLHELTVTELDKNQEETDLEQLMAIYPGLTYEQAVNP
jgi:hypothetical protein